jgi:ABC-type cobalamin/Fe3+-siderophores transport system ATPase subunit
VLEIGEKVLEGKRHLNYRGSPERRAHGEQEARRLLERGLKAAGLVEPAEMHRLKGSDRRKVAIARVIRQRTTVSMGWLAEHLAMRSAANVSQQLRRQKETNAALPGAPRTWLTQS